VITGDDTIWIIAYEPRASTNEEIVVMKIYFRDQKSRFEEHLDCLKQHGITTYNQSSLIERTSTIEIFTKKTLTALYSNFLFNYDIFPADIMTSLCQWKSEKRSMRVGDTIVQQVYLPPYRYFSQKLIMGVRVNNIINESNRLGFSYETLEGHVEQGLSTFTIEESQDGRIFFKIHTFSKPQHVLAKLVNPIFSTPYQAFCTKQALKNMKKQLERHEYTL